MFSLHFIYRNTLHIINKTSQQTTTKTFSRQKHFITYNFRGSMLIFKDIERSHTFKRCRLSPAITDLNIPQLWGHLSCWDGPRSHPTFNRWYKSEREHLQVQQWDITNSSSSWSSPSPALPWWPLLWVSVFFRSLQENYCLYIYIYKMQNLHKELHVSWTSVLYLQVVECQRLSHRRLAARLWMDRMPSLVLGPGRSLSR